MRLSCNFVNVYTIVYHVQYTYTRVHARIPNGHPRKQKLECRTKVRGQVGEEVYVGVGVGPMEFKLLAAAGHWLFHGYQFWLTEVLLLRDRTCGTVYRLICDRRPTMEVRSNRLGNTAHRDLDFLCYTDILLT